MKKVFWTILFVCGTFFLACGPAFSASESAVTALELYQIDDETAAQKYGKDPVVVKGVATYIGPDQYGLPAIELSDEPEGKTYVLCVFPFNDFFKLGEVKKGQEVTVSGQYRLRTNRDGFIVLKQCVIVVQ